MLAFRPHVDETLWLVAIRSWQAQVMSYEHVTARFVRVVRPDIAASMAFPMPGSERYQLTPPWPAWINTLKTTVS